MPDVRCYLDAYSKCPPVADVMSRARFQENRVWELIPWIHNLRTNF